MSQSPLQAIIAGLVIILLICVLFFFAPAIAYALIAIGSFFGFGYLLFIAHKKQAQDDYRRRQAAHQLALRMTPQYRMMQEQDRQFQLAKERQAHEQEMQRQEFALKQHLALTRLEVAQFGSYLINQVDGSLTHLQPIHKPLPQLKADAQEQPLLPIGTLHIPTLAEEIAEGSIGPGQKDMLFCYEILVDDITGQVSISPIRGEIGTQHTQFIVAGSQSGKSTFMARNIGQAAAMGTLFYIIDPHRKHPEKSISAKVAALSDWFILPPASTHEEVARVLKHATKLRDDLIQDKPTPYTGYHIMFIVDEVPALMAWQRSQDKRIRQQYLDLALFMQSIGTQTAKFGMTGLFSSQFATKDELGEIEIRDACMSQLIMRLHPVQAQAMRVLGKESVQQIPKLEKGHGFLMLSDSSEAHRVASGNATSHDLEQLAAMLPPSPLAKTHRNEIETGTVIPLYGRRSDAGENGLKADRKEIGKQIEPALEAKVTKVIEMLGQNKPDIIYAVWGVKPGKSQAYQEALGEYERVMAIIQKIARKEA